MSYPYLTTLARVTFLFIITSFTVSLNAQIELSGRIVDENQEGLSFANVIIEGTYEGTATDVDGNFELSSSTSPMNIIISYIGYKTKRLSFTASEK